MTTNASHPCPQCGAPIPDEAVTGLCPRCVFAMAASPTAEGASTPYVVPSLDAVRTAFAPLEVIGLVGSGGMGAVFKARQPQLDRFVALKILPSELASQPGFSERFQREAQALARLSHPHIVTVHDFGLTGGFYFLLMEFVDGVNLRQAMKAGRFTPEQALAVVPPVCEALQFAHEHGIVHRDIKPENLLLDKDGRVKIADFGIAKMLGDDSSIGLAESQPAGTPQYMAPEQKDHQRADHRADIYSLGVVLYEMLTGELPTGKLEPPSARLRGMQIDVRLDEVVLRALEVKPERRYQTAAEMRTEVEAVVHPSRTTEGAAKRSPEENRAAAPAPASSSKLLSPLRWLIIAVLIVAGLIGLGLAIPMFLSISERHRLRSPERIQPAEIVPRSAETLLRKFTKSDPLIASDVVWQSDASGDSLVLQPATKESPDRLTQPQSRVVRLYEVSNPNVDNCSVLYRARLKTKALKGRAYLEMWCRFPGLGEAFSRGLDQTVSGSNDWVSCQIPFFLKQGEKPDLIRLNVVIEGEGEVDARDIELSATVPPGKL